MQYGILNPDADVLITPSGIYTDVETDVFDDREQAEAVLERLQDDYNPNLELRSIGPHDSNECFMQLVDGRSYEEVAEAVEEPFVRGLRQALQVREQEIHGRVGGPWLLEGEND